MTIQSGGGIAGEQAALRRAAILQPAPANTEARARRPAVPVSLRLQAVGRLPEPVEIAAYYAVSEALTNTAEHAQACAAEVEVAAGDGLLRACARDD